MKHQRDLPIDFLNLYERVYSIMLKNVRLMLERVRPFRYLVQSRALREC